MHQMSKPVLCGEIGQVAGQHDGIDGQVVQDQVGPGFASVILYWELTSFFGSLFM